MSVGLSFDLRLEQREPDRIVVSVLLNPSGSTRALIEGVSLQIVGSRGEVVSARTVLPIAGELKHSMVSTLELRPLDDGIPPGCRVIGVAWSKEDQLEASIPTDPYTELQAHMRALHRVLPDEDTQVMALTAEERATFARVHPWVNEPRLPQQAAMLTIVENEPTDEEALDSLLDELGVDEDSAAWLKELIGEE